MHRHSPARTTRSNLRNAFRRVRRGLRQRLADWFPHLAPAKTAKQRTELFQTLPAFTAGEKANLVSRVFILEETYARAILTSRLSAFLFTLLTLVPLAVLLVWLAPLVSDLIHGTYREHKMFTGKDDDTSLLARISSDSALLVGIAGLLGLGMTALWLRDPRRRFPAWLRVPAIGLFGLATLVIFHYCGRSLSAGKPLVHEPAWELLGFALIVFGLGTLALVARAAFRTSLRNAHAAAAEAEPCAAIVHNLLSVLESATQPRWHNLQWRQEIIGRLRRIALAFDPYLASKFACGHPGVDDWVVRRCTEVSGSVQELAHVAFSPSRDTPHLLEERSKTLFTGMVEGWWNSLPSVEAAARYAVRQPRLAKVWPITRRLLVTLMPGILLLAFKASEFGEKYPVPESTMASIAVLTLTGLMTLLNPRLDADLKTAKSVSEMLKPAPASA